MVDVNGWVAGSERARPQAARKQQQVSESTVT